MSRFVSGTSGSMINRKYRIQRKQSKSGTVSKILNILFVKFNV